MSCTWSPLSCLPFQPFLFLLLEMCNFYVVFKRTFLICVCVCTYSTCVRFCRDIQYIPSSNHLLCPRWSLCPSPCWTRSLVKMLSSRCRVSSRFKVRTDTSTQHNQQPPGPSAACHSEGLQHTYVYMHIFLCFLL